MKPLEPKGLWLQFAAERFRRFAEFNRNGKACFAEHRHHPLYRLLRVADFLGSFCHLHLLSICSGQRPARSRTPPAQSPLLTETTSPLLSPRCSAGLVSDLSSW